MNIWNEKGAFYHNYTPLQQVGGGGRGGGTGIRLSVHPSVDRMVPRLLVIGFPPRVYGLPMGQRCFLLNLGAKVKCTGHQSSNMVSRFQSIILSTILRRN